MSSGEFRASTPADAPAIIDLCQRVLGIDARSPMLDPQLLAWKYWRPWPTWPGPRSHVIARGGELLAHIAAVPVSYRYGARELTLLHPLDWAARPELIGVGAALLSKLAKVADGVLVVGGSGMTQRMLGPLGYRRLADVRRYAAPASGVPSTGAEPLAVRPVAGAAAPPALDDVFHPQLVASRSPALYAAWRECPAVRCEPFEVLEQGQVLGGFMLAQSPGQARAIDVWCRSARAGDWARVLGAARAHAAGLESVAEVVTLANTELEQQALDAAGFLDCGSLPMFVRSALPLPSELGLRFQMIDGDAAFLHHGREERWLG
jgi:hypothetical protein